MAPLAPTKIWMKKEKTKIAPTKIRTEKEKIKNQNVKPDSESSSAEDEDQDEDESSHLHGFSTDDEDSSDGEDAMDDGPSAFDISKLPTIAKDDATVKHKLDKAKRQPVRLLLLLIK
jgi:nucleolar protein 15